LSIAGIHILTPRVRAYLLKGKGGAPLPAVEPGAHLALPVRSPEGRAEGRQFSIASDPDDPMQWEACTQVPVSDAQAFWGALVCSCHVQQGRAGVTLAAHGRTRGCSFHSHAPYG